MIEGESVNPQSVTLVFPEYNGWYSGITVPRIGPADDLHEIPYNAYAHVRSLATTLVEKVRSMVSREMDADVVDIMEAIMQLPKDLNSYMKTTKRSKGKKGRVRGQQSKSGIGRSGRRTDPIEEHGSGDTNEVVDLNDTDNGDDGSASMHDVGQGNRNAEEPFSDVAWRGDAERVDLNNTDTDDNDTESPESNMGQPEQTTETAQGVNVDKNGPPATDDNEQKSSEPNMGQPEQTMEMAEGVIVKKNGPPAADKGRQQTINTTRDKN